MDEPLVSRDPATGEPIGEVQPTQPKAVQHAVDTAREAQTAWAKRSLDERISILETFQRDLLDDRIEVAEAVTREAGKPTTEALVADVMPSLDMVAFLAKHGAATMQGERFRMENPLLIDRTSETKREPIGVVGIIAPWNYPLSIPATQATTALFAGNAVVLKPSELTPLVGADLVDRLHAAGVPENVCQLVQGAAEVGQALVEAAPDKILFTGSVETGRAVSQHANQVGTSATLELGGKDPMLVLDDANVDLAARGAVWSAFTNAGQTCAAVERVYVDPTVADRFTERVVEAAQRLRLAPGDEPGAEVGPMIRESAVERVQAHVEDAVEKGATVQAGGSAVPEMGPCFFEPTVLTDVDSSMVVMQEETFGPVLPIQIVDDVDEAVELANGTRYGLTASVWTTRPTRGERLADQLDAGTVTINDHTYTYAACETPWGGVKASGSGHTHGRWGIEDVTRLKHVNTARAGRAASPWYYPYDEDLERLGDEGLEFLYGSKIAGAKVVPSFLRRFFGSQE